MDTHDTQAAASYLAQALQHLGVRADVHWDRSPWGVAIPLLDQPDIHYENLPSLYVLTENEVSYDQRMWFGCIGFPGNDRVDEALTESTFRWLQRGTFAELASNIAVLVELLKQGTVRSHAMLS